MLSGTTEVFWLHSKPTGRVTVHVDRCKFCREVTGLVSPLRKPRPGVAWRGPFTRAQLSHYIGSATIHFCGVCKTEPIVRAPKRPMRRLSDEIMIAFHNACDQADLEIAERLLCVLEMVLRRPPLIPSGDRRHGLDGLVAAYRRLWQLRHR